MDAKAALALRGGCKEGDDFLNGGLRRLSQTEALSEAARPIPPDWVAEVEGQHPNAAAFLAGWLSAHLSLGRHVWPDRQVFLAMFGHWAETGHLLTLRQKASPDEAVKDAAEDLAGQAQQAVADLTLAAVLPRGS